MPYDQIEGLRSYCIDHSLIFYLSNNSKVDLTLMTFSLCFKQIIQSFTHINSPHVCDVKHVKQTDATQSGSVSAISFEFTNKSITSS